MNISQAQIEQLAALSVAQFEADLAAHVHANFPAIAGRATPEQLLRGIRQVVEQGQGLGIAMQDDLRRFLELLLSHGRQVLGEPDIAEVLSRADLDGTQKMDAIDTLEIQLLADPS